MYYLGIDVSKASSRVVILNDNGEKHAKPFSIENDKSGFQTLLEQLKTLNISKNDCLAGIEATGIWWENLFCFLTENGFNIILLNPHQTNKFREALRKKAKTDDIDAYVIAGLLRSKEHASCYVPQESIQSLREFTKLRFELAKDLKNYQRQAYSLLALVFPEYEKTAIKNPFSIASMAILKEFPTAKDLATASVNRIEKIARHIKGNNLNTDEINKLIQTAKDSIFSGKAKDARGLSLKTILSLIEHIELAVKELEANILAILKGNDNDSDDFPGGNLLTIPGIAEKTVANIIQATGEHGQVFPTTTKFIGHIGFFPQIYQSGESKTANKISNRGPKILRWTFYMAAVSCIRHNRQMKELFNKKVSQGKSKKQALIYVAKKLAALCLSMLKSGLPYSPERVFVAA